MSAFGRSFLRLAACAALRNLTLVGDQVFDSRIAALDTDTFMPNLGDIAGSIGVYTEQDSGDAEATQNGGPPFASDVELIFEIAMQALYTEDGGATYVVGTPMTDDQLEMTLDVIEGQAELAMFRREEAASVAFRTLAKATKKSSIRFTDPKAGAKLAVRYVTYTVEIQDLELVPKIFDQSLTGLDRLPDKWKAAALAWPEDSPEREKATRLAELLIAPALPALEQIVGTVPPPPQVPPIVPPENPVEIAWDIPQ